MNFFGASSTAQRSVIVLLTLALVVGIAYWSILTDGLQAASLSPFLDEIEIVIVSQANQSRLLSETQIAYNKGYYIEIVMTPSLQMPKEWNQREVMPCDRWPVSARIYPTAQGPRSNLRTGTICSVLETNAKRRITKPTAVNEMKVYVRGANSFLFQKKLGYVGPPRFAISPNSERTFSFWTFIAVTEPQKSGDYTLEIVIHPTAKWISSVRSESGPEQVVWRGQLHAA